MKEKKISQEMFSRLCEYLFFDKITTNQKIPAESVGLFENTLRSIDFNSWLILKYPKITFEKIELTNFKILINELIYLKSIHINEIQAMRLNNSVHYMINERKVRFKNHTKLVQLIESEMTNIEKATNLKTLFLESKSKNSQLNHMVSNDNIDTNLDPFEDFSWGDLNGQEAYDAYWNCE
ncbi:MAG: hypothetical protein CVT94_16345 [Bacteroidetes bacterium HGW-Bacteroidetes-11]|jgi:hypothetical protein|nr:MAG: hypothetical protein CVT94_16345 [Bacteroidetes bacterium HGW-Bacteroidetes-11]